jgi:hypothetical protein
LVMLAIGTGWVLPTCPRLPTPSTVSAAEPVLGQGSTGDFPGRRTDADTAEWNTGREMGRVHWSPPITPMRATRSTRHTGMTQRRERRGGRSGDSELR